MTQTYLEEWDDILPLHDELKARIESLPLKGARDINFQQHSLIFSDLYDDSLMIENDLGEGGLRWRMQVALAPHDPNRLMPMIEQAIEAMPSRAKELASDDGRSTQGFQSFAKSLQQSVDKATAKKAIQDGDERIVAFPERATDAQSYMLNFAMYCRTALACAEQSLEYGQRTSDVLTHINEAKQEAERMMHYAIHLHLPEKGQDTEENLSQATSRVRAIDDAVKNIAEPYRG